MMRHFFTIAFATFGLALFASVGTAQAAPKSVFHGGTYWGSVVVERGQVVDGDLNVMFGDAIIEGTVDGDVNVVGGEIDLRGGSVSGATHDIGGPVVQSIVPWAPSDAGSGSAFSQDYRIWWRIAMDVVIVLFFLIFPLRTRMAVDRLEHYPAVSALAGLIGWVAVIPIAVLLCFTIVLFPLVIVEFVALVAAVFIGTAALALLVGRRFYELVQPNSTPSPVVALVLGLALLTAAELVPVVWVLVACFAALIGLGAVILTFVSGTSPAGPGVPPRATIGGPPMPVG